MKGFILNDFLVIKKQLKTFALVFLLFFALTFWADTVFLMINSFLSIFTIAVTLGQHINDINSGWALFCDGTPSSRDDYVKAKYVVFLIMFAVVLCLSMLIFLFNPSIRKVGLYKYIFENAIIFSLSVSVISIGMPFIYKFGKYAASAILALLVGFIGGFGSILSINIQFAEPSMIVMLLFMAASAVLFVVSIKISQKFYRKKEL